MKKSFEDLLEDVFKKYGNQISRKQLIGFCSENRINVPQYLLCGHGTGERGTYDLSWMRSKISHKPEVPVIERTDSEIEHDINSRFSSLELMARGVVAGSFKSLIVSGNPGIGKTFVLESILNEAANSSQILFTSCKGYIKASGLYKMLYESRHKEAVILLDDSDAIYNDLVSLNLLKASLDTTRIRSVSWLSEHKFESDDGEEIPKRFNFNGAVIFCTNLNLPRAIAQGNKNSIHLEALLSRAFFVNMTLDSCREMFIRIRSMAPSILSDIKSPDRDIILKYISENQENFRELSLRTLVKTGILWKASGKNYEMFKGIAKETMWKKN
jgi:hypothetical protein